MCIHNYEGKLQAKISNLKKSNLSTRNKELILEMGNDLVLDNLSKPRVMKYLEILTIFVKRVNKDLDTVTKEDLKKFVGEIQRNNNYSPWTKQTYKVIVRQFYKWHAGMRGTKKYPEIVDWISIRMNKSEMRLPADGDMITDDEVKKMLNASHHPRDKALLAVLWESGARIGEIGNLKLKQVKFDQHGVVLTVQGKTGSRPIRLIWCVPYLSTWIDSHPDKNNNDANLWVNIGTRNHSEPMNYPAIRKFLIELGKKVGVKKRIYAHLFRHSRATFMANHLTEFQMNKYFGWIQGSDMPATYVHMSGKNLDDAILVMNGLQKKNDEEEEEHLQPVKCPRCDLLNGHDTKYCRKCGGVLNIKEAMENDERWKKEKELRGNADKLMDMLLKDDDVKSMLMEKLGSLPNTS